MPEKNDNVQYIVIAPYVETEIDEYGKIVFK
jgi:hypothetical protein